MDSGLWKNMNRFEYFRPESLNEALELSAKFGNRARPLMGGTDLSVRLQKSIVPLDAVIDLKRVSDIRSDIKKGVDFISIGSRMVLADLIEDAYIQNSYPALIEAASAVGSIQIRNRASLTGNICNASPAADTVPSLMVYGAEVEIAGINSRRVVLLKDFFIGPGKNVCSDSELVIAVNIPIPKKPFGAAFERITRRKGVDIATVNVACGISRDKITHFVFGAAGPTPVSASDESGGLFAAQEGSNEQDEMLRFLISKASPISDIRAGKEYREAMLLMLGKRVLARARKRYDSWGN
jgi:CO/xanthine dehydrogenase FAD-binding subunit